MPKRRIVASNGLSVLAGEIIADEIMLGKYLRFCDVRELREAVRVTLFCVIKDELEKLGIGDQFAFGKRGHFFIRIGQQLVKFFPFFDCSLNNA